MPGSECMNIDLIKEFLARETDLELAVLIGSRANGTALPTSDWDIAIQWSRSHDQFTVLGKTEELRRNLAALLQTTENRIDLIELPSARLAIRAVVAEQGTPLRGEMSLPWYRFLKRTWRELEEYHWETRRAS